MPSLVGFEPIELLNYGKKSQNLGQSFLIMVIFKLFTDLVKIEWVIYDGSGNFQDFSGFIWPNLPYPTVSSPKSLI